MAEDSKPVEDKDSLIQKLQQNKPPATDAATYLTLLEMSLTQQPSILPEVHDILKSDVELTSEIGWDLVEMLIGLEDSHESLDTVARLGNPREVILKVLEALDKISEDEDAEKKTKKFVTLCGMLSVLHKRLKVKAPSRFVQTTLDTVRRAYAAGSPEATAAVISLVRSLSGQKRPPLPTRKSSAVIATLPAKTAAATESAPDPEADTADVSDEEVVQRLLRAFITCCIDAYVNANELEWASRLLEYTYPEKIVPGRPTMMRAYNEVEELKDRDDLIGQLAGLADDLGLAKLTNELVTATLTGPITNDPLQDSSIAVLATGGYVSLLAYWMFSSDVFDAHHPLPDLALFPSHHTILTTLLADPQTFITSSRGTVEALIVIALWLHTHGKIVTATDVQPDFMAYHHLLTLIAVFHANIRVRNAATTLAGHVLHSAPEDDRLSILEDLIENCMFSTLQACAVTWLKDEIVAATPDSRFASPDCLESLQYTLFPDLTALPENEAAELLSFWAEGSPYHLQVANFAVFLLSSEKHKDLVPAGMPAAIEHRYVEPLLAASEKLQKALKDDGEEGEMVARLEFLRDALRRIPLQ